jgi:beta-galactosidase
MDYIRFVSASARNFVKMQSDILRKYIKPGDFITTNGLFGNLDNHAMTKESLDFLMYDSYPNFAYCLDGYREDSGDLKDRKWSRNLTEVRSVSPVFGIMEQQSGANGWNTRMEAPTPRPGQITLWTMQSIAHGADYVSYFRWRTCTMGTEIYWHGILDYSGRENRRLREVQDIHQKLSGMQEISGALYDAQVAVLKDYDNVWDAQLDVWHERVDRASLKGIFEAAQLSHTPLDFVYLSEQTCVEDLKKYKVIFYPHATIMTRERAELLETYVKEGGTLIVGCRSGYKDLTGKCIMERLPGLLSLLTGCDIPEYSLIALDAGKVTIDWDGEELEASVFTDLLEALPGAEVVGTYTSDYYAGSGALVHHAFGNGHAYYYGSAFTRESAEVFLRKLGVENPWKDYVEVPSEVEIAVRKKGNTSYLFLLNYAKKAVEIELKRPARDLYTQTEVLGPQTLPAYGTMVLRLDD